MRVHLVNPSHLSFGVAVITPRWLFVLAAATPTRWGDPVICDETLEPFDAATVASGDVVGIGIHTGNALRGYEVGRLARAAGALVIFGGIHATLFPDEPHALGGAHAVVKGDGEVTFIQYVLQGVPDDAAYSDFRAWLGANIASLAEPTTEEPEEGEDSDGEAPVEGEATPEPGEPSDEEAGTEAQSTPAPEQPEPQPSATAEGSGD